LTSLAEVPRFGGLTHAIAWRNGNSIPEFSALPPPFGFGLFPGWCNRATFSSHFLTSPNEGAGETLPEETAVLLPII